MSHAPGQDPTDSLLRGVPSVLVGHRSRQCHHPFAVEPTLRGRIQRQCDARTRCSGAIEYGCGPLGAGAFPLPLRSYGCGLCVVCLLLSAGCVQPKWPSTCGTWVGWGRFELPTSASRTQRSAKLSHHPENRKGNSIRSPEAPTRESAAPIGPLGPQIRVPGRFALPGNQETFSLFAGRPQARMPGIRGSTPASWERRSASGRGEPRGSKYVSPAAMARAARRRRKASSGLSSQP